MAVICPTITASNAHTFRQQIEKVAPFAVRIHIDLTDGLFATTPLLGLDHIWWPHSVTADLHLMYERPDLYLDEIIKLKPNLVIIHAEAQGNFPAIAKTLHHARIKVGVALLENTPVDTISEALEDIDYVLIFSGNLGHQGGDAKLKHLDKVKYIKNRKPEIEVGWDGGITNHNAKQLADGGIDVLNVGGYIQRAKDPVDAYAKLKKII